MSTPIIRNLKTKILNISIYTLLTIMFIALLSQVAVSADSGSGTIKGKVNYCGKGGYVGMQVFIPGRQFMVLLGTDGQFIFEGVPVGHYDINYAINGRLVNENKNISVSSGGTNDLGTIVFCAESDTGSGDATADQSAPDPCVANPDAPECLDADKDGVVAAKDCNDHDPAIKPGAIELCDGVDNNCNGQVDEESIVTILNGFGNCNAGKISIKSCNKGFENCDKDPSNGCETDIYNDRENCGQCGNACSALETCNLGIC